MPTAKIHRRSPQTQSKECGDGLMFPKFAQGDILVGATIHYPDPVYRCIMSEQGLLIRPIPKPPNYCQYAEGARVKILLPPLSQTHYFSTTLNTILRECDGGSISGTGFAIEDFQPLHVKRAIENGRRNRVRHLNSPSVREFHLRGR